MLRGPAAEELEVQVCKAVNMTSFGRTLRRIYAKDMKRFGFKKANLGRPEFSEQPKSMVITVVEEENRLINKDACLMQYLRNDPNCRFCTQSARPLVFRQQCDTQVSKAERWGFVRTGFAHYTDLLNFPR